MEETESRKTNVLTFTAGVFAGEAGFADGTPGRDVAERVAATFGNSDDETKIGHKDGGSRSGSGSSSSGSSSTSSSSSGRGGRRRRRRRSGRSRSSSSSSSSGQKKSDAKMAKAAKKMAKNALIGEEAPKVVSPPATDPKEVAAAVNKALAATPPASTSKKSQSSSSSKRKSGGSSSNAGSNKPVLAVDQAGVSIAAPSGKTAILLMKCTASFQQLADGTVKAEMVCANSDLKSVLGGSNVPISSMEILKVGNNFPAAIGVQAPHLKGNDHNVITSAGKFLVIADSQSVANEAPLLPKIVHRANPSPFQMLMAKHYPGKGADHMISEIQPGLKIGEKIIPANSALCIPIRDAIENEQDEAKKKNTKYTGPTLRSLAIKHRGNVVQFNVPDKMAEYAANWLSDAFAKTKDTLDVDAELKLPFARAGLDFAASNEKGAHWLDRTELLANPKVKEIDAVLKQPFTVWALVSVKVGST
jgi:hypothetical protein